MYTSNALIRAYMKKSVINHIDELTGRLIEQISTSGSPALERLAGRERKSKMYTSNALIRAYMKKSVINHIDELTGEIGTTALAEDAAHEFDLYDSNDNIPEYVFDIAYEVSESIVS